MTDPKKRIEEALDKGYAAAILDELGADLERLIAYCDLFAVERWTSTDEDHGERVLYVFPDATCIVVTNGTHAETR